MDLHNDDYGSCQGDHDHDHLGRWHIFALEQVCITRRARRAVVNFHKPIDIYAARCLDD